MVNGLSKAVVALIVTAFLGTGFSEAWAAAGTFPARPLRLVVPWEAGSAPDQVARDLAPLLEERLGQPVRVVNRTGGGGALGYTVIATARPDGYTLGLATAAVSVLYGRGLAPVAAADFRAVGQLAVDPEGRWPHSGSLFEDGAEPSNGDWEAWWGLVVPRHTPGEAVRVLETALEAAYGSERLQDVLREHGLHPRWLGADAFQQRLEAGDAYADRILAMDAAP